MKNENICTHDIETFRDRIEKLRGDTPQKDFCKGIGISVRTYQNWVNPLYNYNGKTSYTLPNIETAMLICDKYGVSLDYLFGRIDCETITNKNICDMIGLNDQGIKSLKSIKQSDNNAINTLNDMISVEDGSLFEILLQAYSRVFAPDKYCVPVYHTNKAVEKDTERHGKIKVWEVKKSDSGQDVVMGHTRTYKEKRKIKTDITPDTYIQHFATANDLYDNIPVPVTSDFMQAVALKQAEQALLEIKKAMP